MHLIPLMVALPLVGGFLLALMPRRRPRLADLLANVFTVALVVLAIVAVTVGGRHVYRVGGWSSRLGIVFVLDGLSALMVLVVAVVSLAATLFSVNYMDRYTARPKYYGLFLLMVAGMNGVILTGDVFNLFVFLEIASIASYALVAFGGEREELEASFKYAILGSVASTFILLGIAMLYMNFGVVNMARLGLAIDGAGGALSGPGVVFALMLFIAGLGLKAALVPFHAWLPDAHPSAPAPISAMLSGVLIKAIGLYALVRIAYTVFGVSGEVGTVLLILGGLSMVVGALLAMGQSDMKRMLAYSSISQVGYIALAFGLGTPWGMLAGLFHLMNHAVFKSLLFLTSGAVEYRTGTRDLRQMGGLSKRMPITAGSSLVGSLAISGVPPFNGFVSKVLIVIACINAKHFGLAALAILVSIVTLAYFFRLQRRAFFGPLPERWATVRRVPFLMGTVMVGLAVLCLVMSLVILPGPRKALLDPAREALLAPGRTAYIRAVTGPDEITANLPRSDTETH